MSLPAPSLYSLVIPSGRTSNAQLNDEKSVVRLQFSMNCKIDDLSELSSQSPKVWVTGSYKVGKSSVLNVLSDSNIFDAHESSNSKNVMIGIKKGTRSLAAYCDTEGFNQPISAINNPIKKDFIINVMARWGDIIIFVVDRMTDFEYKSVMSLIKSQYDKRNTYIILHNVKTITTSEAMISYIEQTIEGVKTIDNGYNIEMNKNCKLSFIQSDGKAFELYHFFIGQCPKDKRKNIVIKDTPWVQTISELRILIDNYKPLIRRLKPSLNQAVKAVIERNYVTSGLIIESVENGVIVKSSKFEMVHCNSLMQETKGYILDYGWYTYKRNFLILTISLAQFKLTKVEVKKSDLIELHGERIGLDRSVIMMQDSITPHHTIVAIPEQDRPISTILGTNSMGTTAVMFRLTDFEEGLENMQDDLYNSFKMPQEV